MGKGHLKALDYTGPVVVVRYDTRRSKEVQMNIKSFTFLQEVTSLEQLKMKVTTTNSL